MKNNKLVLDKQKYIESYVDVYKRQNNHNPLSHGVQSVGNTIRSYGLNIASSAMKRNANNEGIGLSRKISSCTSSMMKGGLGMINPIPVSYIHLIYLNLKLLVIMKCVMSAL